MRRRIVVTGVGAISPLGIGADTLFRRWRDGESGIEDGKGRCDEFDPGSALSKKEQRSTDRFAQLALAAAQEAMEDAGWDKELPYEPQDIGCIIGSGFGGILTTERQHDVMRERGHKHVSPLTAPMIMPNAATSSIGMRYGLKGPSACVATACAAGTDSIGVGTRMIQAGDARAVVAGGAEASLAEVAIASSALMGATSKLGISRPFDARRDGFVMGEGAGVLILEDAEFAEARGATPLAEVLGYGASADAFHLTAPDPEGGGASYALQRALTDAALQPEDISYVNAHGTSTPMNDRVETNALKRVLGDAARDIPISSTKSVIGHTIGAAGAVEAIATIHALRNHVAPPTVNYDEVDPDLDLDYVPVKARALPNGNGRLVALSNSFGFGGHNAVVCLGTPT
jgi:3-oxoacyl-[acyl-carrier-protein] synthase II